MSLKALHVCFIVLCVFLSLGFGYWALKDFGLTQNAVNLWMGIGSLAGAIILIGYLVWFLSKMKKVNPSS